MGSEIPWYTITDDFGVDEWHGTSVFSVTTATGSSTSFLNGRGDEALGSTFSYLDITALGRQEDWEDSPAGYPQTLTHPEWCRLPNEYGRRACR